MSLRFRKFQRQDFARAALVDGLIKALDTGLGKTIAAYTFAFLKLGFEKTVRKSSVSQTDDSLGTDHSASTDYCLRPKAPVLLVAPGDLHKQMIEEGETQFHAETLPLDSQAAFERLNRGPTGRPMLTPSGRPVIPPGFYITSYTQLASNGVKPMPDMDKADPWALLDDLSLSGHQRSEVSGQQSAVKGQKSDPLSSDLCPLSSDLCLPNPFLSAFFRIRGQVWRKQYDLLDLTPSDSLTQLESSFKNRLANLDHWHDQSAAQKERNALTAAHEILKQLMVDQSQRSAVSNQQRSAVSGQRSAVSGQQSAVSSQKSAKEALISVLCPLSSDLYPPDSGYTYADLTHLQQTFVCREFLRRYLDLCSAGIGECKEYPEDIKTVESLNREPLNRKDDSTIQRFNDSTPSSTPPKWTVKCLYSPSLADLCYNAFDCVVVDEGVKMKGANTAIGLGVRIMNPRFRCVLTATPIKNRLPDIYWLLWWAAGGQAEAHARFPYSNDPSEQQRFAETFCLTERNLSKEAKDKERGIQAASSRYKKLTPEICNVHRLWKLLGPNLLRRRKQDTGEEIMPKTRKVIRCQMGTAQRRAYAYHLQAEYVDVNGLPAMGARLQSLRQAAADPTTDHLPLKPGKPCEPCGCRSQKSEVRSQKSEKSAVSSDLCPLISDLCPPDLCPLCHGRGSLELPHRSTLDYTPKIATVLGIIEQILHSGEQVLIGAAFNDPLRVLGRYLEQAGVPFLNLVGATPSTRGRLASEFKSGRHRHGFPIALAGVESMANGHSFHRASHVILFSFSWAYDLMKQFDDRVWRLNSIAPVTTWRVICEGTIDRKLESLLEEKSNASDLALDGQLLAEKNEEISLPELLRIAEAEFTSGNKATIDETTLLAQWPDLKERLRGAAVTWREEAEILKVSQSPVVVTRPPATNHEPQTTDNLDHPCNILTLEPEPVNIIEIPFQKLAEPPSSDLCLLTPDLLCPAFALRMAQRSARLRQAAQDRAADLANYNF